MKPDKKIAGIFRLKALLRASPPSYLVVERGRTKSHPRVLKWLPVSSDGRLDELRTDILDLASLVHPALELPSAFGRDPETGRRFVLRRYVQGSDILSASRGRSPGELLPWLEAAAEAIEVLHRFGFLHGNLKASNFIVPTAVLFSRQPRDPKVVLCDPELALGAAQASYDSDLHALGTVFYELLTGRAWNPGQEGMAEPPSKINPHVPVDLERVVLRLLLPDRKRRYQKARALLEDLERLLSSKQVVPRVSPECFLGRTEELTRAVKCLEGATRPAAIAVTGEAGMGKSAFLRRLELEAQLRGYRTIFLRSYSESSGSLAFLGLLLVRLIADRPHERSLRLHYQRLLAERLPSEAVDGNDRDVNRPFIKGFLDLLASRTASPPTLVLVDEVHRADSLAIEVLAALVREIGQARERDGSAPALPSLAVAHGAERPFQAKLEPITKAFDDSGHAIFLRPLPPDVVDNWLELALEDGSQAAEIVARARGNPFAVWEAIRTEGIRPDGAPNLSGDVASIYQGYLGSVDSEAKALLAVLAVLGRPATTDFLGAVLRSPPGKWRSSLQSLLLSGILAEEGGRILLRHGSFQSWLLESIEDRGTLHRRIAISLEERRAGPVEEIAHHWLRSDDPRRGIPMALEAARHFVETHEVRRALDLYEAVLERLPRASGAQRRAVTEEAAEAQARAGQHLRAVSTLKNLLGGAKDARKVGSLHGRIGIWLNRAGEIAKAVFHLEKGRSMLAAARGKRWLRETIRVDSELAEIASNRGQYDQAEERCRRALGRLAGRSRAGADPELRREEMVLLETWAHLRVRRYQYREARSLFERSLRISQKLGAVPERCLILNNLGILHNQENRFEEAVKCYKQAEKLASRLGLDQILVNIESNLALLYAKAGKPEEADDALGRAERHEALCESRRARFLRLHSAGVVHLYFGRYAAAMEAFAATISLGEELKDFHVVAFDRVYLGQCRLFRGEARAALAAFDAALGLGSSAPAPIAAMAEARKAVLAALQGDSRRARAALKAHPARLRGGIPYLEAWDRVFLGWGWRLLGKREEARRELEEARVFFRRVKVPAGEIHASLELFLLELGNGDLKRAERRRRDLRSRFRCGQGPLRNPMLSARLLAYQTLLLIESGNGDPEEASSLLVEAESYLIGHRLWDLEGLVRDLRRRIGDVLPRAPGVPGDQGTRSASSFKLVARSSVMKSVVSLIQRVASTSRPILITGETGAGKEVIARAIHEESRRSSGPFVSINCAAVPADLLEAELFGYRSGAFTGAERDRAGLLVSARSGTFLFDEIGEMPLTLQGKLLRLLDHARVRPLGGEEEVDIDVRYLFSTNRDLRARVEEGLFRRDLFFRLSALEVTVPPLRERLEDLPDLVRHFESKMAGGPQGGWLGGPQSGWSGGSKFDVGALRALGSHSWPGNVRELENVMARLVLTCPNSADTVSAEAVRLALGKARSDGVFPSVLLRSRTLDQLQRQLEKDYLIQLHADRGRDLKAMAAELGITRRALYKRFKVLGIRHQDL